MAPVTLSIVVPAFNEGANLGPMIRRTIATLDAAASITGYEILVVDDGSTDATGRVGDDLAREFAPVRVIHHAANGGFGAAIRSGYQQATGEYTVAIPADGEVPVEEALRLLAGMGDADIMVSRRERSATAGREILTRGWHAMMRLLVGSDLAGRDGIYVIRTSLLQQLTLRSSTGLINLEILMQCANRRVRIGSGVMRASPRLSGESKVTNLPTLLKVTWEMIKLRLALPGYRDQ